MERYVAYMRVSTERQGRSGLGLAAQRKLIAEFVEGHGELCGEFIEIQSGRRANREILWQAIKEAQRLIPNPIDQYPFAHSRSPMDMMRQG